MSKWMTLLSLIFIFLPVFTFAQVEIVEVMCNPVGSDTNGEWVKVKNTGADTIDITGWKFNDGSNHNLNIPPKNGGIGDMTINPGESFLLANKAEFVSGSDTIIDTVMSLNNAEDTLSIIDNNGTVLDTFSYVVDSNASEGDLCLSTQSYNSTNTQSNTSNTTNSTNNTQTQVITKEVIQYKTVTIQPPEDIYIREIKDKQAIIGSSVDISAEVYDATGAVQDVSCTIAFGDGSEGKRCQDSHIYNYAGQYAVVISATKGTLHAKESFIINIQEPKLLISVDKDKRFVEIFNKSDTKTELNNWQVKIGYKRYKIPKNTTILPNNSIKLSESVIAINISRFGGKAELINAFNKVVASSTEYELFNKGNQQDKASTGKLEVLKPQKEEEQKAESDNKTNTIKEINVDEEKSQENIQVNTTNKNSIIGTRVEIYQDNKQKSKELNTEALLIEQEEVKEDTNKINRSENELRDLKDSNIASSSTAVSIIPENVVAWLIGLVLLLGLAITPVFVKDKNPSKASEEGVQDVDNENQEDKADTFTITEIR